jgi:hypothetical protein
MGGLLNFRKLFFGVAHYYGCLVNLLIYCVKAMEHCHGNKSKAAALLGLKNYQTLNNWIEKYNIN